MASVPFRNSKIVIYYTNRGWGFLDWLAANNRSLLNGRGEAQDLALIKRKALRLQATIVPKPKIIWKKWKT